MLKQGSIVQATVSDPQGRNAKLRPLVVVTSTSDLIASNEVRAVAITGRFTEPLQADEVRLPYHPGGQAKSGLRKPCVAKCSWLVTLSPADVVKQSGFLGAETMVAILRAVGALESRSQSGEGEKP